MSAIRKVALSAAALSLSLSGLFLATANATADNDWNSTPAHGNSIQCDNDWNTPEPTPC